MADASFLPANLNVTGKAGDRVRWTILVTDDNNVPLDWSGYVFAAQVRLNPWDAGTPVATITVDATNAVSGQLVLTVSKTDTAAMLPPAAAVSQKAWYWDLQRTASGDANDVRTTHGGTFTLLMDVTR